MHSATQWKRGRTVLGHSNDNYTVRETARAPGPQKYMFDRLVFELFEKRQTPIHGALYYIVYTYPHSLYFCFAIYFYFFLFAHRTLFFFFFIYLLSNGETVDSIRKIEFSYFLFIYFCFLKLISFKK